MFKTRKGRQLAPFSVFFCFIRRVKIDCFDWLAEATLKSQLVTGFAALTG